MQKARARARWFRRFAVVLALAGMAAGVGVLLPDDHQPRPPDTETSEKAGGRAADQSGGVEAELADFEAQPPDPGQVPPSSRPEGHRNGQAAVDHLGDRLAEVAVTHGMTEGQLRSTLLSDRTLWLDPDDRLYFVEAASEEADAQQAPSPEPVSGAASADENRHPGSEPATVEADGQAAASAEPAEAPFPLSQTFLLHSNPGSSRVIYLDFDGDSVTNTAWQGYEEIPPTQPIVSTPFDLDGSPSTFSAAEQELIQGAWQRVAEDFAAFDVDVTTEYPGEAAIHDSSDGTYGSHVVIAGTNPIAPGCGCGGIAYLTVFNLAGSSHEYYQPAFAFQQGGIDTVKEVAEVITHEVGHNVGLVHDDNEFGSYYGGHGPWAPIMGVGYSKPVVHWSNADYPGATNNDSPANGVKQNDYVVMGATGLPVLPDLVGDARNGTASPLASSSPTAGLITTPADKDVYSITSPGGLATIQVENAPASPNLDVRLQVHNSAGALVHSEDPMVGALSFDLAAGLDATAVILDLPAGSYFVTVEGVGADPDGNPATYDAYTDYGSIGAYTITAGFGVCGIDDDLDDDDTSTERMVFPSEGASGKRCAGDDDWLRVPGVAGATVSATVSVQDDDLTIELVGPNGTTVLDDVVATSATPGTVSAVLPSSGDHYLRVTGASGAESRYSLTTALTACPPDDQYDAIGDDFLSTTVSMSIPGSKQALMCSTDSANGDFTQLPLTAGHRIEATIDFAISGANDLEIYLYKDSSSSLSGVTRTENADGTTTIAYTPLATGNHQLQVYRWGGTAVPYALSVVQYPQAAPTITTIFPASSGPVGEEITLVGSGFAGATGLTFSGSSGNVPATFQVLADTTINTTVPVGAVTGPITVTNGAGSGQRTFTVLEGGRITGTLTGPANTQIWDCVTVWDAATEEQVSNTYVQLDLDGSVPYESSFLATGTYRISAGGCEDTARTYYDGVATFAAASDVTIVAGSNTTGIDLEYKPSTGSIAGTVTGSDDVSDLCVSAISALTESVVASSFTAADGTFAITGLVPGTYYLGYGCGQGMADATYMIEYWESSEQGSYDFAGAEYLFVTAGGTTLADTVLDAAATISGTLTSSAGGAAADACIEAYTYGGDGPLGDGAFLVSDAFGAFSFPARIEGDWEITFGSCRPDGWRTLVLTTPLTVSAGASVDASQTLDPAPTGGIEGTVTQEGGTPLQWICVDSQHGDDFLFDQTTAAGAFGLYELDPGTYTVRAGTCAADPPNVLPAEITVVVGTDGSPTGDLETGQDIVMLLGGAIEGNVVSTEVGFPAVNGVCVSADNGAEAFNWTETDATGDYRIEQLPTGTYTVTFSGCEWDEVSWAREDVTGVAVTRPATTTEVNALLDPGASLSGTVTESDEVTPIFDLCVELAQADTTVESTWTDFDGSYVVEDLAAGTYDVVAGGCGQEIYMPATVTGIVLAAGADVVQDISVLKQGLITGTVTGADTVTVTAYDATTSEYVNSTGLNEGGDYQLFVPPGSVRVSFYDEASGTTVWFNGTDITDAEVITLAEGEERSFVDAVFQATNTAPTVSWVTPTGFDPVKGRVTLQVDAFDFETLVSSVEFYVDSQLVGTATGTDLDGYWSVIWNSAATGDGQTHTIEAIAYDDEGLSSDPATITPAVLSTAPADFDGDGTTDIAVFRPTTGRWYIRGVKQAQYGENGDIPVPADYNGDGTTDIALFRPTTGRWYIQGILNLVYGQPGDIPAPAGPAVHQRFFRFVANNETDAGAEADLCSVVFPGSMQVSEGSPAGPVYARLFEPGVTEAVGAPPGVTAHIGWGPDGSDPRTSLSWSWTTASVNPEYGPGSPGYNANEDEFIGTFTAPRSSGGPYDYTYRFSLDGGATATYCDTDGAGSGPDLAFDGSAMLGQLTVTP